MDKNVRPRWRLIKDSSGASAALKVTRSCSLLGGAHFDCSNTEANPKGVLLHASGNGSRASFVREGPVTGFYSRKYPVIFAYNAVPDANGVAFYDQRDK